MRIAVTGANGRLGRAVVAAAAAAGHDIIALDRVSDPDPAAAETAFPVVAVDVTDYDALLTQLSGCDGLIHLAARPSPWGAPPQVVHANNVVGNYNALMAAAEVGIRRVVCASSINAIGGIYSHRPRFDYFPVDEAHPTYAEDAYSLSKWLGEQQADAVARLYPDMRIASLRFHGIRSGLPPREVAPPDRLAAEAKHLWGWVDLDASVRACLLGLRGDFTGHEVFFIVAPTTTSAVASGELHRRFHPDVPLRRSLEQHEAFYDCGKATRLLGWVHDE